MRMGTAFEVVLNLIVASSSDSCGSLLFIVLLCRCVKGNE